MNKVNIEIGESSFSVCTPEQPTVGDCVIDGIKTMAVAHEVAEILEGELEEDLEHGSETVVKCPQS